MPFPTYQFAVDFGNNGTFVGTGEDVSARVLDTRGFTCERGRNQVKSLAQPQAGQAGINSLDNRSRDYSTENGSSPLAGNLLPGRRARATAVHSAVTYNLFSGVVDDIEQHPEDKTVSIPLLGTLSRLAGQKVTTALYRGITTDAALIVILDAVGWPALERVIQTGQTTLLYWWLDDADAFDAVAQLVATEGPGATVYEDGAGNFIFENRHNRLLTTRSTTSQATFRDSGTAPWHTRPFTFSARLKEIVNTVVLPVNVRTEQALGPVWTLNGTLNIPALATVNIVAKAQEPFSGAYTPVVNVDYTVTDGSVTGVSLDRTSGASATIAITGGASGATITGLQLRAYLLTKTEARVASTVDVSASVAKYGIKTYNDEIWPEIGINTAQDFANAIALAYREPRAAATITVEGVDDTHRTQCLAREISDRITVVEAQTGLNADMMIEWIGHEVGMAGRSHVTQFGCEKAQSIGSYALWGSATWGSSTWAF
jgi:hypothetical protein